MRFSDLKAARQFRNFANKQEGHAPAVKVHIFKTFRGYELIATDRPANVATYGEPVE